jgi:hypothetical protein
MSGYVARKIRTNTARRNPDVRGTVYIPSERGLLNILNTATGELDTFIAAVRAHEPIPLSRVLDMAVRVAHIREKVFVAEQLGQPYPPTLLTRVEAFTLREERFSTSLERRGLHLYVEVRE